MNKIIKNGLLEIILTYGSAMLSEVCFGVDGAALMNEMFARYGGDYANTELKIDLGPLYEDCSVFSLSDDYGEVAFAKSFKPGAEKGFIKGFLEKACGTEKSEAERNAKKVYVYMEECIFRGVEQYASQRIITLVKKSKKWNDVVNAYIDGLDLTAESTKMEDPEPFWDIEKFEVDADGTVKFWGVPLDVALNFDNVFKDTLRYISKRINVSVVDEDLDSSKLFFTMCGREPKGNVKVKFDLCNVMDDEEQISGLKFELLNVSRSVVDGVNAAIDEKIREAAELKGKEKKVEIAQEANETLQKNIAENKAIIEQYAENIKRVFSSGATMELGAQMEEDPEQFKKNMEGYYEEWLKSHKPN